jgi:catechol 2,3-dioxygenase-like lactoylglutathione lyase family enzyme
VEKHHDTVDHVAIVVTDIAAAVDWYASKFSCEVAYKDATWALLRFANVSMALVLPGEHPAHVGFHRDDIERFGDVKTHRDGVKYVYTVHPFGNSVEIVKR